MKTLLTLNPDLRLKCPSCGYPNSLSVTVKDGKKLYFCHAGCTWDELKAVVGESNGAVIPSKTFYPPKKTDDGKRAIALKIWTESHPAQKSLVEVYLKRRGIYGHLPPSLRFIPRCYHQPTKLYYPAMIASVVDRDGAIQAVHRTYLDKQGRDKAPVEPAKMTLASVGGYSCHLGDAGEKLCVSEGIETGLSVQLATGLPTWAALSAGGMKNLILPTLPLAAEIILCADHDEPGRKAAEAAAQRMIAEGRRVRIATPKNIGNDWNDEINGEEQ